MQKSSKKIQILAPAGSVEQLVSAVNNCCDAVYLGLDSFNARMKAPNFNLGNLSEWIDYCHVFGVKVYVAINTSLKNDEFLRAVELLLEVYKRNADGVIVSDLGLMKVAGALPKPFEVVASTQLNVHDRYGAEFVKKCGATTVVCARECSLDDIREVASTGIGVECFLHGAMCVCQSGQCLFSSMVGGNSGNRGLCAQPCRKLYNVEGADKSGYLLSARDMCGLDVAGELISAGATTFKIEGRNRRAEYAGLTSRVYRHLLDNNCVADVDDFDLLAEMFNRSMTSNRYLFGCNSGIICSATQNHIGVQVGVIKRGGVLSSKALRKGDGLKVFEGDKEICGGIVLEDGKGLVKAQFSKRVLDGMRVCRTTCLQLNDEVFAAKRKLDVKISFTAKIGHFPVIGAECCGVKSEIIGNYAIEEAVKSSVSAEEITKQLSKSGNTHYTISDIVCDIDNIFIAKSQLNALRRAVLDKLTKKLLDSYNSQYTNRTELNCSATQYIEMLSSNISSNLLGIEPVCVAICHNEQELQSAAAKCNALIYKPDVIDSASCAAAAKFGAYVDLPSFANLNYVNGLLRDASVKLFCNNVGQVEFARKNGLKYIAGGGLNLFNDCILHIFADSDSFVYSRELTLNEIYSFGNKSGLIFVDGQIPLMQLCHCPYKVAFDCDCASCKADKELVYCDELGNRFTVKRRRAGRCLFELINGNKLSVVSKLKAKGRYLIDFDERIVEHYLNINNGAVDEYSELRPYTKGRLYDKIN